MQILGDNGKMTVFPGVVYPTPNHAGCSFHIVVKACTLSDV